MIKKVKKRDGRISNFNPQKIYSAIERCIEGTECTIDIDDITNKIVSSININCEGKRPYVEEIQDIVENELMSNGYHEIAKKYILYRQQRTFEREKNSQLMNIMDSIFTLSSEVNDMKRDNANTNTDAAMGTMLKIGSESSKDFYIKNVLKKEYADAHLDGLIHIHDLDFYNLTTTCTQIDLEQLLKNGFSTGNGSIRSPRSIRAATALVAIVLQSNQNDQHGGQSIANIDWDLAPYVSISYQNHLKENIRKYCELAKIIDTNIPDDILSQISSISWQDTEKETQQAMEALIHNLNTMSSRAGARSNGHLLLETIR